MFSVKHLSSVWVGQYTTWLEVLLQIANKLTPASKVCFALTRVRLMGVMLGCARFQDSVS
jgi:hypothetical protein